MATVVAALAVPLMAHAGGYDPMRCEAVGMRKSGQLFECLGRCDRRDARRTAKGTASSLTKCQQNCQDRYDSAMNQVEQRDVCNDETSTPDPNKCQARLMHAGARHMVCESGCVRAAERQAFDSTTCIDICDTHYAVDVDRIMAKPYCAGQEPPTN
jgi:hypothetical protein